MDAAFSFAGLSEELGGLLEDHDFLGAEELLTMALGRCRMAGAPRKQEAFIHYQFGRLYREWNKLSSAINHLNLAAELAALEADSILLVQIVEELKLARKGQHAQRP